MQIHVNPEYSAFTWRRFYLPSSSSAMRFIGDLVRDVTTDWSSASDSSPVLSIVCPVSGLSVPVVNPVPGREPENMGIPILDKFLDIQ